MVSADPGEALGHASKLGSQEVSKVITGNIEYDLER